MPSPLLTLLAGLLPLALIAAIWQLRRLNRLARRLFLLFLLLSWLPALSVLSLQWFASRRVVRLLESPAVSASQESSLEMGRRLLDRERRAVQDRAARMAGRWDDRNPPVGVPGEVIWILDADDRAEGEELPPQLPDRNASADRLEWRGRAYLLARAALGDGADRSLLLAAPIEPALDDALRELSESAARMQQLRLYSQLVRADALAGAGMLTLVLLLICLALSRWFAARVGGPIQELAQATRQVAAGQLSHQVPVRSRDELGDLARDFNSMTMQLRESKDRLLRSERLAAWQGIARRLAHEIKNPLTPIHLALHRLRAHLQDPDQLESLDTILEETGNLRRLADEFSLFARLPQPHLAPCALGELLRAVVGLYHRHEGIELRWQMLEGDDLALADEGQIRQVFSNLIKNALEAMGERGTLELSLRPEGDQICVEIADDGVGLPEAADRIFDADFSTKSSGSGLGLAICRRIMEEHQGSLSARPRRPRGTVFRLCLPRSRTA